jgi:hypothetical protein
MQNEECKNAKCKNRGKNFRKCHETTENQHLTL